MIHVVATLSIDPSRREEFLSIFAELTPTVLSEAGCIEYVAAVDEPTPIPVQELVGNDKVMVLEKWESVAALETHLAAPHMETFREQTAEMLRGVTLSVFKPA